MNELFIGRKRQIKYLKKKFFVTTPGKSFCCSLIGPNDIGKTMLVKKMAEEFRAQETENVYYIYYCMVVEKDNFLWTFWKSIVEKITFEVTPEKLRKAPSYTAESEQKIAEINTWFAETANSTSQAGDIKHQVNSLFSLYTDIGIHILLAIDEFDLARQAYPLESGDGSFFQHLFLLSPKSANNYNLSIMLISRRHVNTIAHHMGGSNFPSAYPSQEETTLRGFTDEELEEYFRSYEELDCGMLDEQERKGILYFCGRHPGLLMRLRDKLDFCQRKDGQLDIAKAFHDARAMEIYKRMVKLMKEEYVDNTFNKNCIGPFAQLFIGPAYDEQLTDYIETIYERGFLTMAEEEDKSLCGLVGMDEDGNPYLYEPLSLYFVEYFKNCVLPDYLDATQELLNLAELKIREVILKILEGLFPDTYQDIIMGFAPKKDSYLQHLRDMALEKNAASRNLFFTKLDVMAFNDYAKIISKYWIQMKPYFGSYAAKDELKADFLFLNDSRNCYAHNNQRILMPDEVQKLEVLCRQICNDIEAGEKNVSPSDGRIAIAKEPKGEAAVPVQKSTAAAPVKKRSLTVPVIASSEEMKKLEGKEMILCEGQKKDRPNQRFTIQGKLKGTAYRATISAQYAMRMTPPYNGEIEVIVEKWDSNGNLYQVKPV